MANLYADEDLPSEAVGVLQSLGHDVVTIQERGMAGIRTRDETVVQLATDEDRAVLTHNKRHYIRLHRVNSNHAGIIICSQFDDKVALAKRIHDAIEAAGDLHGQLVRVVRPHTP